jgi:hypothetical protein
MEFKLVQVKLFNREVYSTSELNSQVVITKFSRSGVVGLQVGKNEKESSVKKRDQTTFRQGKTRY